MSKTTRVFTLIVCILLISITLVSARELLTWKPLKVQDFTYKRLLTQDKSHVFYYKPKTGKNLTFEVTDLQRIRISSFSLKDSVRTEVTVQIDKQKKSYPINRIQKSGKNFLFEDLYISLTPGKHVIKVWTKSKNLYLRPFQPKMKKVYAPISLAKPASILDTVRLTKGKTSKAYYLASADKPFNFTVTGNHQVIGYARASLHEKARTGFQVYRNGELVKTVEISLKKTKQYTNSQSENLTIGKKFDIPLVSGKNTIELKPIGKNSILFRIYKIRKAQP